MPNIIIATNTRSMPKLDRSVNAKVSEFLNKLSTDPTLPGLHIEPIRGAVDPRVRTGRVDLNYRAILFRMDNRAGGDPIFVYLGTWPHDEANRLAERSELRINPVNGIVEGILGALDGQNDRKKRTVVPDRDRYLEELLTDNAMPMLQYLGFTLADLTERLGLDGALAEAVWAAADEDAVTELLDDDMPPWQRDAVLDLITGTSIDDIRGKLGLNRPVADDSLDDADRLRAALEHPASKMQFTYITDDEELRRIIEGGDFAAWRTFLHPEQQAHVERPQSGSFRLSGGAGTGKTVVAIHRARHLANQNPQARIVLTTFNKTLAMGLAADLRALDPDLPIASRPGEPGIYVAGLDKLGSDILAQCADKAAVCAAVFGTPNVEVTNARTKTDKVWRELGNTVGAGLDARLAGPGFLENEYVSVVLANRVTSLEQYARVARPGRGVRLSRPQRIAVWKLVEAFRRQSRIDATLSFPEVLALAAESLRRRAEAGIDLPADHVIVDEAQDLHATHWALLRALVAESPNDLFIAEDSHQRIYGQPVVLARFGVKIVGRSRRLTLNYRTTAQNLSFAVRVLSGADYRDLEQDTESTHGYRSARSGPEPTLLACTSAVDELNQVAQRVRTWIDEGAEPSTIAVLTRGQNDRGQFVRALGERGIEARALEDNLPALGQVQVLTMHRSKGMEFSKVVLAGIDDVHVPSAATLRGVPEEEQPEALLRERSLLYVAASRARDELVVTWSGQRSGLLG